MMTSHEVIIANSNKMDAIADKSVHLIVRRLNRLCACSCDTPGD